MSGRAPRRRSARYWPDAEQELLLRAGLLSGPPALEAWQGVRARLDLARDDPASRRLLPLLHANLRRHGVDDRRLDGLEAFYRDTRARNEALFGRARALARALGDAGIAVIALKGWPLAVRWYGDAGLRPMTDVDLLVPAPDVGAASDVLGRCGWTPVAPLTPATLRVTHASPFVDAARRQCDLHWHVFAECCWPGADDDLWADAIEADLDGARVRVLSPTHQLLHVCVHGTKYARTPGIRWVADAVTILGRGGVDWARLVERARARRFVLRLRETLAYLREGMEAAVPPAVLEALRASPVSVVERVEYRAGGREPGLLGALPILWCNYRRSIAGPGPAPAWALGFPRYLGEAWGLGSLRQVPGGAAARARRRLRTALGRAGPDRRGGG